ncbi:hypothetical protein NSA24_07445 [Clostridioides mangenotii]|uniref:hypothetical protein n=1 Tax=Metaclostridioides mangenotii TaxID=1540 RepID=UPI00214A65DC|nr:hypothetical protein [Clostridioides mangenotii]MCR1954625.1 hypothetical protein [Clostridioides mangenotii]
MDDFVKTAMIIKDKAIKSRVNDLVLINLFMNPKQTAMALMLEANLGLRISDVLRLKVGSFKRDKLEIREKKT